MSGMCGNCDCSDSNQCVKKGSQFSFDIVVESNDYVDAISASENDGNCKCGSSCGCTNCSCGCH